MKSWELILSATIAITCNSMSEGASAFISGLNPPETKGLCLEGWTEGRMTTTSERLPVVELVSGRQTLRTTKRPLLDRDIVRRPGLTQAPQHWSTSEKTWDVDDKPTNPMNSNCVIEPFWGASHHRHSQPQSRWGCTTKLTMSMNTKRMPKQIGTREGDPPRLLQQDCSSLEKIWPRAVTDPDRAGLCAASSEGGGHWAHCMRFWQCLHGVLRLSASASACSAASCEGGRSPRKIALHAALSHCMRCWQCWHGVLASSSRLSASRSVV